MSPVHHIRRPITLKQSATSPAGKRRGKTRRQQIDFGEAMGAAHSFTVTQNPNGPFGVAALLDEIKSRLVSRGGRPADSGPTIRRLVPIRKGVWSSLKAQADLLSRRGKRVSPAQLAALLVEKGLSELKIS